MNSPAFDAKRIRDIAIEDIQNGTNWKLTHPNQKWSPLEGLAIVPATEFTKDDYVVYSAVWVTEDGEVTPLVLIRQVGHPGYGGDYCEFVHGRWRQVGLVPNPHAPPSKEHIANPLGIDTSFSPEDYREEHEVKFRKWAAKLKTRPGER